MIGVFVMSAVFHLFCNCSLVFLDRLNLMRVVLAFSLLLIFTRMEVLGGPPSSPNSGPEIGSQVSSFYVRAVTGPQAGKTVCYVCRNGDRPVIMVFLRQLSPEASRLLKRIDIFVNDHRADGLRCFVVLLSDSQQKDSALLQTIAFDEKIELPLTIANKSLIGPTTRNLAPESDVSVVLYHRLKVVDLLTYDAGKCNDHACDTVISATEELLRDNSTRGRDSP